MVDRKETMGTKVPQVSSNTTPKMGQYVPTKGMVYVGMVWFRKIIPTVYPCGTLGPCILH